MKFQPGRTPVQALASLKEALTFMENAEHCAVLWFAEIYKRRLYRQFGYSSINQFATVELQFSRTRTGDFIRLAAKLDQLPTLRNSLADGLLGYSKAQEIIKVATPKTERDWVQEAANCTRASLRAKVKRVRESARKQRPGAIIQPILGNLPDIKLADGPVTASGPGNGERNSRPTGASLEQADPAGAGSPFLPADPPVQVVEIPVKVVLEMMPEQFARYESLLEKLRQLGYSTTGSDRTEVFLDGLAALGAGEAQAGPAAAEPSSSESVAYRESARRRAPDKSKPPSRSKTSSRSKAGAGTPPAQINVHKCPRCGEAAIITGRGELPITDTTFQRLACDASLNHPGLPNKATIPPGKRRAVLTRDRNRCRAPGCRHVHHLEVHHIVPRSRGGSNRLDNLITLCGGCHRIWHEKGGPPAGWVRADGARE